MRILMLAPQPFFEPRGTPFSVLGRLKALSALGHQVDLLTYHIGQDVTIPGVTIYRTPRIGFIKSIKVGPSPNKVLLDTLMLFKAARMLMGRRYDLLHTHEEASFFGVVLAKLFRIPHLYDMHSSLAEQLSNMKVTSARPLVKTFEWLEQRVVRSSVGIITICPALEERIKQINGHVPQMMIENVASERDPSTVTGEEVETFRATHPLPPDKRIILYTGTLELYQGIGLLADSARRVLEQRRDVLFLVVGGKPDQVRFYQQQVEELGAATHFQFTGVRPAEEIPLFIKLSHVLVSPRTEGTNTPLKIYSYLQSGKPIVATDLPTHTQVMDSTVAVLVEPQAEAFARGILSVLEDPQMAQRKGQEARRYFEAHYSFQSYLDKTDQILRLALG